MYQCAMHNMLLVYSNIYIVKRVRSCYVKKSKYSKVSVYFCVVFVCFCFTAATPAIHTRRRKRTSFQNTTNV